MITNITTKKVNSKRILENIIEHVGDMERNFETVKTNNWNRETKNRYFRDLTAEVLTLKIIIRQAETDGLYDRLTELGHKANVAQVYLND